ncbi:hypothetical protein M514_10011 [Trichuris suis]|uniref:Uncharacterized protein n=1 Tax=Trichuris suis TaxID=68888 RepID=A0A085NHA4_9BILA|nr:hypothetical protein M513_10011 [Trichuris suis]KFD68850.1 hypothetical protein M514_10011 [Trichuris suis]
MTYIFVLVEAFSCHSAKMTHNGSQADVPSVPNIRTSRRANRDRRRKRHLRKQKKHMIRRLNRKKINRMRKRLSRKAKRQTDTTNEQMDVDLLIPTDNVGQPADDGDMKESINSQPVVECSPVTKDAKRTKRKKGKQYKSKSLK